MCAKDDISAEQAGKTMLQLASRVVVMVSTDREARKKEREFWCCWISSMGLGAWEAVCDGLTWRRRLNGTQDVKVSLFIMDFRKLGQLGWV